MRVEPGVHRGQVLGGRAEDEVRGRPAQRRRSMNERKNVGQLAGLVLHILIGGLMIFTGSQKILGSVPPEALVKYGLGEQSRLIGTGALVTALLLLIPRTASLGI